jgi:hypothetical protein
VRATLSHLPFDLPRPYPEEHLKAWRASNDASNIRNNWPELVEVLPETNSGLLF